MCRPQTEISAERVQGMAPKILPVVKSKLVTDCFTFTEKLGSGQFGVVRICVDKFTKRIFACKSILKRSLGPEQFTRGVQTEVYMMSVLPPHPNIVQNLIAFEDEEFLHIIMEKCHLGDLFKLIKLATKLPEATATSIFRKLAFALFFCHSNGVVHCDLKPENILLTLDQDGQLEPKLADFGLARLSGPPESHRGFVGSVAYSAPEIFLGEACTEASDVWSLGVLLYVMLTGMMPFGGTQATSVLRNILKGPPNMSIPQWSDVSELAKNLVRWMLQADIKKRPTMEQVLQHPWISQNQSFNLGKAQETSFARCETQNFSSGQSDVNRCTNSRISSVVGCELESQFNSSDSGDDAGTGQARYLPSLVDTEEELYKKNLHRNLSFQDLNSPYDLPNENEFSRK